MILWCIVCTYQLVVVNVQVVYALIQQVCSRIRGGGALAHLARGHLLSQRAELGQICIAREVNINK